MPGKKNDKKLTEKQKSLKRRRERDRKDKHVQRKDKLNKKGN